MAEARKRDPITIARHALVARGAWDDAREEALAAELRAEVDAALGRAMAAPDPAPDTLARDVYAEGRYEGAEGVCRDTSASFVREAA